jgi:hypothetical protein
MKGGSHSWTLGPAAVAVGRKWGLSTLRFSAAMERRRIDFDYETRQKWQQTLIEFLNTELAIGPTFVKSALLAESQGHTDHMRQAKAGANKAGETVRRFVTNVGP